MSNTSILESPSENKKYNIGEESEEELENNDNDNKENTDELDDIQKEIEEMTKKIEIERNHLRLVTERYEQSYSNYCELEGKPVPKTKEMKEKEKIEAQKERKKHKVSDRIVKKKLKEQIQEEKQEKEAKLLQVNEAEVETLTKDINNLVLKNNDLKEEIKELRQQKLNEASQRDLISKKNEELKNEIEKIGERNQKEENKGKQQEVIYQETLKDQEIQAKDFNRCRDEKENEYHHILEKMIQREKEAKQEKQRKRDLQLMINFSKVPFGGKNSDEIQKQIKTLKNEEISDRTPILKELLTKWTEINEFKLHMIEKFQKNSGIIREVFDKIMAYFGLETYKELPLVFEKSLSQLENIQNYITELDQEIDKMSFKKEILQKKIEFLTNSRKMKDTSLKGFTISLKQEIHQLNEKKEGYLIDILSKKNFFFGIQPSTDSFLHYLGDTYLSNYAHNFNYVESDIPYNEKTVNSYIAGVEDFYKLIQIYFSEVDKKQVSDSELKDFCSAMKKEIELMKSVPLNKKQVRLGIITDIKNNIDFSEMIKKNSNICLNNNFISPLAQSSRIKLNQIKIKGNLSQVQKTTTSKDENNFVAAFNNNEKIASLDGE